MTYDEFKENFLPEFLKIRSFAGKIRYANENLTRIGSGTGRIVFDIDGEKVLKLAKNPKGIAQNEAEAGAGYYHDTQHIVTEVFESADDNSWLVSEKANKVNEKRIKEVTGIPSLNDLYYFLRNFKDQNNGGRKVFDQDKEVEEFMWENEFAQDLANFIANYNQSAGDMGRPSTYGEVLRDGQPAIVLTDYGLNDEVYNTHYSPDRKKSRYQMYELYNYADGNDDILSDAGGGAGGNEIRTGMWAQMPYSVSDGGDNSDAVINEEFIDFVSKRDKYPDKPISSLPVLTDHFHECVNNINEIMRVVEDKPKFYNNLLELQNYLIRRGFYDRDPLLSEEYLINEDLPPVEYDTLKDNREYSDKIAKEVAGKLGLSTPRYLGGGGNGFAYEINNNVVLKLTTDISEADAASRLMRGQPKNIATIYKLYKVLDTETDKSIFALTQENIKDKPVGKLRKFQDDITKIIADGLDYEDIMINIKKPARFNHDEWVEWAKKILTENPAAGVSELDRQAAYEYLVTILNIRQELLDFGIKSTDYITISNQGYSNGVLKFFDVGGYYGVGEPNIADDEKIQLPEDGSAKFTTDNAVNQDDFPVYNTNDTSPMINNDLDANIAMYEDLIYNHVKGDATEDEYMLTESRADFLSWKRKNVTIRGMEEVGKENNGMASFGQGLYTAALGNKELARKYGKVYFVVGAIPNHPKIVNTWNDAEIFMQQVVVQYGKENGIDNYFDAKRDFDTKTNVRDEMLKLGYDGLIIKGREMVHYTPEDVKYFKTEQEVENYYDTIVSENIVSEERDKSYGAGSKTVEVKKKCKLGGLGNTSVACNQGDINNLVLKSIKERLENGLDIQEYFSSLVPDMNENNDYENEFPIINGNEVRGLSIRDGIPNMGSIDASLIDYEILDGIREVSFSKSFPEYTIKPKQYSVQEDERVLKLAEQIKNNREISPLIVVIDKEGAYILEGGHRFDALRLLGIDSFPAKIVLDLESLNNESKMLNEGGIMSLQDLPFKSEIEQLGGKIYSVGGAVRDEFLGKDSKDLDILITGIPMKELERLLTKYGKVNLVGANFGVLKFVPRGSSEEIDIAIPRTETATGGGGHKDFNVTSDHALPIEKDLERRDFTINAIGKDSDGNVIDPYGGQEDLKNKIIRIVNPVAFSDDPLRMLRAVQFASRFGFVIEPTTMDMIKTNAEKIKEIPPERILIELDKIVKKGNKRIGAQLLQNTGLFNQIFGYDLKPSTIDRSDFEGVKTMGEFLFLLTRLLPEPAEFVKNNLKGDIETYKQMKALQYAYDAANEFDMTKARIAAHNVYITSKDMLQSQILPELIGEAAQELLQGKYPKSLGELAVNGNDLIGLGLEGKEIGKALKNMLVEIYDGNVRNNKEELLSLVNQKPEEVKEGYPNYSDLKPAIWKVNGEDVTINFFVEEYDKWNYKYERFTDASRESVLRFVEDEFPQFVEDEKLKRELYWKLTDRDLLNEESMKKISYSAVVLDDKSRTKLLQVFKSMIPEGWEIIAHHMTINMGELDEKYRNLLNNDANLNVTSYAIDDLVMAVGVSGFPTMNKIPHITIAVNRAEGGKPFLSNKLTDWKPIGFTLSLTGKVNEVE